ncbi:MAG: hypothetical protein ACRCV0_02015, partial [Brevinema sp.]
QKKILSLAIATMNQLLLTENKKIKYNGLEPTIIDCESKIEDFIDYSPKNDNRKIGQSSQHISPNTVINGDGNTVNIIINNNQKDDLFIKLINIANEIENNDQILQSIEEMKQSINSSNYTNKYKAFMSVISDHISVFSAVIPLLTQYL